MRETSLARMRSADLEARTALVELDGSEGTAVVARLGDGVQGQMLAPDVECVVALTPGGERTVVATLGHDPDHAGLPGSASTSSPPQSFAYTDGVTWQDALTADVRTADPCALWASGWLGLRGSSQSADAVWQMRVSVDGAGVGPVVSWGSALANLHQVCMHTARVPVAGAGTWRLRLQLRVVASGVSVQCSGGLLLAEARG
ncbi:MAG: hypothetical protein M3Q29_11440 [Chloroflexota bacterium]|nr:hypothetical protein [Chloroflexota bacterium]